MAILLCKILMKCKCCMEATCTSLPQTTWRKKHLPHGVMHNDVYIPLTILTLQEKKTWDFKGANKCIFKTTYLFINKWIKRGLYKFFHMVICRNEISICCVHAVTWPLHVSPVHRLHQEIFWVLHIEPLRINGSQLSRVHPTLATVKRSWRE